MMSTTGFTTENFMLWPHLTWISLILVSIMALVPVALLVG